MKRTIVVIALFPFLLLLAASCHKITYEGNTGKIVYTHYDPAININLDENQPNSGWDTIFLDFDRDGSNDMMIYFAFPYDYPAYAHALGTWQLCGDSDDTPVNELNEYQWVQRTHILPTPKYYLRHKEGDGHCYGWIHSYMMYGNDGQHPVTRFYVEAFAYCTCLNYPIQWGER